MPISSLLLCVETVSAATARGGAPPGRAGGAEAEVLGRAGAHGFFPGAAGGGGAEDQDRPPPPPYRDMALMRSGPARQHSTALRGGPALGAKKRLRRARSRMPLSKVRFARTPDPTRTTPKAMRHESSGRATSSNSCCRGPMGPLDKILPSGPESAWSNRKHKVGCESGVHGNWQSLLKCKPLSSETSRKFDEFGEAPSTPPSVACCAVADCPPTPTSTTTG